MKYLNPSFNTGGASESFDEGFDRTFGARERTKGRWVYRKNEETGEVECVQVDGDYVPPPRSTGDLGKFEYDNLQATDGTDISSRTKRRRYMEANGLADPRDFREHLPREQEKREQFFTGKGDTRELADAVGRAAYNRRRKT